MNMDCREAELLIPRFLNDEMDNWQLDAFLEHVQNCKDCKEELTIQILVKVGLEHLEDGSTFNLSNELNGQIGEAKERLKQRRRLQGISFALQALVAVCVIIVLILSYSVLQ